MICEGEVEESGQCPSRLSSLRLCGLRRGRALPSPLRRVDGAHRVRRKRAQVLANSPLSHLQQVRDRQPTAACSSACSSCRESRVDRLRFMFESSVVKGSLTAAEHAVRRLHLRDLRQFELELLLSLRRTTCPESRSFCAISIVFNIFRFFWSLQYRCRV